MVVYGRCGTKKRECLGVPESMAAAGRRTWPPTNGHKPPSTRMMLDLPVHSKGFQERVPAHNTACSFHQTCMCNCRLSLADCFLLAADGQRPGPVKTPKPSQPTDST